MYTLMFMACSFYIFMVMYMTKQSEVNMNLQSHVYSPKKQIQFTKYISLHISAIGGPEGLNKSPSVFYILIQCISNPEQTPPAVIIPCDCICPCLHLSLISGTNLNKNWQIFMSMSKSICICFLYGAFLKTMSI